MLGKKTPRKLITYFAEMEKKNFQKNQNKFIAVLKRKIIGYDTLSSKYKHKSIPLPYLTLFIHKKSNIDDYLGESD